MTDPRDPHSPPLHRFLRNVAGVSALSAAAVAGCVPTLEPGLEIPAATAPAYQDSLREPLTVRSVNGVLSATLDVSIADLTVTRDGAVEPGTVVKDTVTTDTLPLRAYTLAATTDPAYGPNDPRFTARVPRPTFRVQHGDLVRIQLINSLPQGGPEDSNEVCKQATMTGTPLTIPDVFQGCFHGFDYTNIHYHGMHVTPDSTSTMVGDDVLMVIAPGDTLQYSFRIPQNQSPGTHWYHPHKHGSVAIQVANGMAGAFIVEDTTMGLDPIVKDLGMIEHVVAVQQVAQTVGLLSGFGELDAPAPLVNGQLRPTIYMAPGEVQRWRIVNENTTRTTKTFDVGFTDFANVAEPSLFDVARDGVQFAPGNYDAVNDDRFLHMAPGQRLDVFVQAPRTLGRHQFQTTHIPGAGRQSQDPTLPVDTTLGGTTPDTVVLFYVVVDSTLTGRNTTLPSTLGPLPAFLAGELPAAADTALIVFTDSLNQQPTQFYLGSRLNPYQRFDDHSVFVPSDTNGTAMPMVLNQTQTWKIVNNSQQQISHPFHIHINPFQVDTVVYPLGTDDPFHGLYEQLNAAARAGNPIWLDVLPLPLPTADTLGNGNHNTAYAVITQKYDDFDGCPNGSCGPPTGSFVMHCHILGHEERGMMQVLQITEDGRLTAAAQGHGGGAHGAHTPGAPGGGSHEEQRQAPAPGHRH